MNSYRLSLSAFVCALIALMWNAHAQSYKPTVETYTLNNGLNVVLHVDTTLQTISVISAFKAGSALDPPGKFGLANLCGGLVAQGSKNMSGADIQRIQYESGGSISGMTAVDMVTISSTFPARYLETALTIDADRMATAAEAITQEQIDREIRRIVRRQNIEESAVLGPLMRSIYAAYYPEKHPYGHPTVGDSTDLKTVTLTDVQRFIEMYYRPNNACLTLGGNFDPKAAKRLIEKYFAVLKQGPAIKSKKLPPLPPLGSVHTIFEDGVDYARIYLIFPTVPRSHPDAQALALLGRVLASSIDSRLQKPLRDKNPYVLASEAYQSSQEFDGSFWITVHCKKETVLQPVYREVKTILTELRKEIVSDAEIAMGKNWAETVFLSSVEQYYGLGWRCDLLARGALLSGDPLLFFADTERQMKITPTQLRNVAAKYITDKNYLIVSIVPPNKRSNAVEAE